MSKEAHFSRQQLDEIKAAVQTACEDEDYLTEMEWRERVFSKLLEPLSKKFKSNAYDTNFAQLLPLLFGKGTLSYLCSRQGSGALQRADHRETHTSLTKCLHSGALSVSH